MDSNKNMDKQNRVNAEAKKIKALYKNIDARSKKVIEGLIQRAAYMRITLEDYEQDLDANGYVEMFSQSPNTDPYERERPVARLYNTMNKNYQCIMKQLADFIPKEQPKQEGDGFEEFCGGKE